MYSVARLCPVQNFLSLFHRCNVAGQSVLYKVNSNSKHCLFSELSSASTRVLPQPIYWSLKYEGVERPNLQGVHCRPRFECGMTFPAPSLIPDAGWVQGYSQPVVASPSCVFFNFPWRFWGSKSNL